MSTARRQAPRFKVGDWISFQYGSRRVWAQIIEDRGPIGVNGRRLYRIRLGEEASESVAFEVAEDDLSPAQADRAGIIDYLKRGGLVAILRSNLGGGPDRPKAWLQFDPQGRFIHTLSAERGLVGGATVPFFALQANRVFAPKAEEVIGFLSSFGLSRTDAEDVLRSVGTAP
jgi:hypothetical protein